MSEYFKQRILSELDWDLDLLKSNDQNKDKENRLKLSLCYIVYIILMIEINIISQYNITFFIKIALLKSNAFNSTLYFLKATVFKKTTYI